MALTSSIYRLARSEEIYTADEQARRLRARLRRLIEVHGVNRVVDRITHWPGGEPAVKVGLLFVAESLGRSRAGSF